MIWLASFVIIVSFVIILYLLVETKLSLRQRSIILAVTIPLFLGMAATSYFIFIKELGYPIEDYTRLNEPFSLKWVYVDHSKKEIIIVVQHENDDRLRTYMIRKNFENNKNQLQKAGEKAKQGVPQKGKRKPGERESQGDFVFYNLPPAERMPKD